MGYCDKTPNVKYELSARDDVLIKDRCRTRSVASAYFRDGLVQDFTSDGANLTITLKDGSTKTTTVEGVIAGTFEDGLTVTSNTDVVVYADAGFQSGNYNWTGEIPEGGKIVPPGSTPESTGGIGSGAWLPNSVSVERTLFELGYNPVGSWPIGGGTVDLTGPNDVIRFTDGTYWRGQGPFVQTVQSTDNPNTTGGFERVWVDYSPESIDQLKMGSFLIGARVYLAGYYAKGDGGGGWVTIFPPGTMSADDGEVIDIQGAQAIRDAEQSVSAAHYGVLPNRTEDLSTPFRAALVKAIATNRPLDMLVGPHRIDHVGDIDAGSYQDNQPVIRGVPGVGDIRTRINVDHTNGTEWLRILTAQSITLWDVDIYTGLSSGEKAAIWRSKDGDGESYSLDDLVTPQVHNGFIYRCTVAGESGNASQEPAWPTVIGQTVVDNQVTWTCDSETDYYCGIRLDDGVQHHVVDIKRVRAEGFTGAALQVSDIIDSNIDDASWRKNHIGFRNVFNALVGTTLRVHRGYSTANDYAYLAIGDTENTTVLVSSQFKSAIFELNGIGIWVGGSNSNLVDGCYGEANQEFTFFDASAYTTFIGNTPVRGLGGAGDQYVSRNNEISTDIDSTQVTTRQFKTYRRGMNAPGYSIGAFNAFDTATEANGQLAVANPEDEYVGILVPSVTPINIGEAFQTFSIIMRNGVIENANYFPSTWSATRNNAGSYTLDFGTLTYRKPRVQITPVRREGTVGAQRVAAYATFIGPTYNSDQKATSLELLLYEVALDGTHTAIDGNIFIDLTVGGDEP